MKKSEKAFTLIELLVVIGILSLLMAVLMGSLSGVMESARAAKCLTNMKNLALGCQNYCMSIGSYPYAGSFECLRLPGPATLGMAGQQGYQFEERPGWISWNSGGAYRAYAAQGINNFSKTHLSQPAWHVSTYCQEREVREYCLTNGTLYKMVGGNRSVYRCPCHKKKDKMEPLWSYVMNGRYVYDYHQGAKEIMATGNPSPLPFAIGQQSDKVLLFAEMQYAKIPGLTEPTRSASPSPEFDCVLQVEEDGPSCPDYAQPSPEESIGFNHKASNSTCAHIVFADGHTEKLQWPKKGLTDKQMKDLTYWLCNGYEVTFNGRYYEKYDH